MTMGSPITRSIVTIVVLRAAHEDGHVLLLPQHVADEGLGTFKGTWRQRVQCHKQKVTLVSG